MKEERFSTQRYITRSLFSWLTVFCVLLLSVPKATAQTKPLADSLSALAYLDSLQLPHTYLNRVPPLDSTLHVTADENGLYYKLDSLGLLIQSSPNTWAIDSLRSFTPVTLSYMHLLDSLGLPLSDSVRIPTRDSMGLLARDTLGFLYQLDSLGLIRTDQEGSFLIDSLATFTPKELKLFARQARKEAKAEADSLYKAAFHMLESFAVVDSLRYRRVISWTHDAYFNDLRFREVDTNLNSNFHDYAYLRNDVGATNLGIAGSPTLTDNYFKRKTTERFDFWSAGMTEAYDRETLPFYNTKSPFTVMSYAGTLFNNKQIEESNVYFLHTQNLSPATNIQFYYQRKGANGLLDREATNTRSLSLAVNHLGKRYLMHAGYLTNSLKREENGGISDDYYIQDTVVEARTIPINLTQAESRLRSKSLYITQTFSIPLSFFKKGDSLGTAPKDSLGTVPKDTLATASADSTGKGTVVFLGHSGEWTTYSRVYTDNIARTDRAGREFYHDQFFINPTATMDSVRTMKLDNRVFLRLQPWASNAIVSKIEGGVGYELLSNYAFRPSYYIEGNRNYIENNMYVYAGANGQLKKYFQWNARGRFDFAGYYLGDMMLDANARFSVYPMEEGIHLSGRFFFKTATPDWYAREYYSNHFVWNNDFDRTTDTRIEVKLDVPSWKLHASFSYGMLNNGLYYDTLGVIRQSDRVANIMTASLEKNFKLWYFHLDHRAILQLSSDPDRFPLPLVSANFRYYIEYPLVKNVLTAQLGADVTFHTKYYVPGYNPALGVFQNQNQVQYGNTPYIDAFINLKWKRATIFVKYVNAAMGWPTSDYFSAAHYIRPQRTIKLGMTWPFYIRPGKDKSVGGGGSSQNSGGPSQNSGGSSQSSGGFQRGAAQGLREGF